MGGFNNNGISNLTLKLRTISGFSTCHLIFTATVACCLYDRTSFTALDLHCRRRVGATITTVSQNVVINSVFQLRRTQNVTERRAVFLRQLSFLLI